MTPEQLITALGDRCPVEGTGGHSPMQMLSRQICATPTEMLCV